ncbi:MULTISPECIES: SGNH/GDSL hydrolase family protein [Sphingomonas]|uniref:GDSL-type esterase/lipase family protein n=1 Tax=Sphingomonas molluscorum TaxID=418184 RepID=A0ABU8Q8G1_9SPHN|nr:SGNH/GDSL hydrolase family protein [Sphingomonas sp. JUb134]MBM7407384.1 lysophospholipase L1-like esterase [Sphingomonas sp. JUb134]
MMLRALLAVLGASAIAAGPPPRVERLAAEPAGTTALPMRVVGRAEAAEQGMIRRQWPGTYVETRFRGRVALFRVGAGEVSLRVTVDEGAPIALVRPVPGLYRVGPLAPGAHVLRVQAISESQAGPTVFGGFRAAAGTRALPAAIPARQIEFVGDSHTVGYGVRSTKTACSTQEVWDTTDTARGLPGLLGERYHADYRVNAISGRGVVRNYDGYPSDTLPAAYPFTLFDKARRAADAGWHPQVIVVALGTNDFSTALHAGERWKTRAALHEDFERSYARFLSKLRSRNPHALIVVWATPIAQGEVIAEARATVARLMQAGERRIAFVAVDGLGFGGCNGHPDLADDARIAGAVAAQIDALRGVWNAGMSR